MSAIDSSVRQASNAGSILSVDRISVQYGDITALRPISFELQLGALVLVLGPNGAGKTSLLKALAGAIMPNSGRVSLSGAEITLVPAHRRVKNGIALVPEGRGRLPGLSVQDNLDLGWHSAAPARRSAKRADFEMVFDLFPPLRERLKQDCSTLSGGEMQMLAIARAMLAKPIVLLLDEPSLGLAPLAIARVYDALRKLNAQGLSMVLVEQKAVPLRAERETTIVLQNGQVVLQRAQRPTADELSALYLGAARGNCPA